MTAEPDQPHVGLVVEGLGDRGAVPIVLRRYPESRGEFRDVLGRAVPCNGRGNATAPNGLAGFVATAANRPGCVGVLVVLDGDDDLVCLLGPELLGRAPAVSRVPVFVCLAERDFEDWLCADVASLQLGEQPAGNNSRAMIKAALAPTKYVKPTWQPRLTHRLDLVAALGRSPSLARTLRRFDRLCEALPPR